MNDLTLFTIETTGIHNEPVRLCVASYTQPQAKKALEQCAFKVKNRDPLQRRVEHMPKSVVKEYKSLVDNPGVVHRYEFSFGKWVAL